MWNWVLSTLRPYRAQLAGLLAVQMACAILASLQPRYYQQILSIVVHDKASGFLSQGVSILALLALIYLSGALYQSIGGYLACAFSSNLLKQLQML